MSCILPSLHPTSTTQRPQRLESLHTAKRKLPPHISSTQEPCTTLKLPSLFIRRHSHKQPATEPIITAPIRKCISDRGIAQPVTISHALLKIPHTEISEAHPYLCKRAEKKDRQCVDLEALQLAKELQNYSFGESCPRNEYTVQHQIKDLKMLAKRDRYLATIVAFTSPHKLSEKQMDNLGLL